VFFGSDFVTVTKSDDYNWPVLKPDIFAAIMDHFSSGEPLFTDKEALEASDTAIHEDDDEVGRGEIDWVRHAIRALAGASVSAAGVLSGPDHGCRGVRVSKTEAVSHSTTT
jgi:hypothetical protein